MSAWRDLLGSAGPPLAWTLGHALWQTTLLALAFAAWRRGERAGIRRRHVVAQGALALGLVAAVATFLALRLLAPPPAVAAVAASAAALSTSPMEAAGALACLLPAPDAVSAVAADPAGAGRADFAAVLTALWAAAVLAGGLRLIGGLWVTRRLRREATAVHSPALLALQRQLAERLGLERPVALLATGALEVPAVVGWRRPAILLPPRLAQPGTEAMVAPLLAHELAHVRGGDYAANLVHLALDALFLHCPGARWLSSEVRRLREYRCDDAAVAVCTSRDAYVRALAALAGARTTAFGLAPSAGGPRLVERLRRLSQGDEMTRLRPVAFAALATSFAGVLIGGLALLSASWVHSAAASRPPDAPATIRAAAWDGGAPFLQSWAATPACRFLDDEPQDAVLPGRFFYCSPLRLDGQPLDWSTFNIESKGFLTVVHGDPGSVTATPISFRVRLRRDGHLVTDARSAFLGREVSSLDLADVLAVARLGDKLIIEPTDPRDWRAKRIVALGGC